MEVAVETDSLAIGLKGNNVFRSKGNTAMSVSKANLNLMSALPPIADMRRCIGPTGRIDLTEPSAGRLLSHESRFHWRRKAALIAALHREETERLAVVRHSIILPLPATTPWQRRAASLSHMRTTLFANAAHLVETFFSLCWRQMSSLFSCTGTPLH